MTKRELEISFTHELYDPKNKVVYYKRPWMGGSNILYKIWIYVTGKEEDIDKIREVKYIFPAFPKHPVRTVTDRDNYFKLIFWAWGGFRMNIIVTSIYDELYEYTVPIRLHTLLAAAKLNKSVTFTDVLADQYLL